MSLTGNSHHVTRGSRFSRAPPHHNLQRGLPAFLTLHGKRKISYVEWLAKNLKENLI